MWGQRLRRSQQGLSASLHPDTLLCAFLKVRSDWKILKNLHHKLMQPEVSVERRRNISLGKQHLCKPPVGEWAPGLPSCQGKINSRHPDHQPGPTAQRQQAWHMQTPSHVVLGHSPGQLRAKPVSALSSHPGQDSTGLDGWAPVLQPHAPRTDLPEQVFFFNLPS